MANAVLAILRLLWKSAQLNLHVGSDNPFSKLGMEGTPARVRVWTPAELAAVLKVADAIDPETGAPRDPEMGDAVLLAHELGQRQADICKLTWDQVDRQGRFLIQQNKTAAKVAVKPTPELTARLEDARRRRAEIAERIRKGKRGPNAPIADTIVFGCTTLEIAAITGHSPASIEVILKHYWKATTTQADRAMDKLMAHREKVAA
jgi:integrase